MKSWSQILHKMLDALAFANASHLGALQSMLQNEPSLARQGRDDKTPDARPCASAIKIAKSAEIIQFARPPHAGAGRNAA